MRRQLFNPVTGDRLEFLNSPLAGEPGPLVFRSILPPGAAGSPVHRHGGLTETFAVEEGTLDFWRDGSWTRLAAGEAITVRPGDAHGFRNDSDEPVAFLCTVTPGSGFERFLRIMQGLAEERRTNAGGMPRDPRALAAAMRDSDLTLAGIPGWLQQLLLAMLAPFAARLDLARFWRAA